MLKVPEVYEDSILSSRPPSSFISRTVTVIIVDAREESHGATVTDSRPTAAAGNIESSPVWDFFP